MQSATKPVIDFSSYIAERTIDFTGREWVFQRINEWLAYPGGSRYFLLTGEPGSGKTAIASRLSQFSRSSVPSPAGAKRLTPGFISALHFCSARDSRWINPYTFTESLAMQLAEHYPVFAQALVEKSGDRQIRIEVQQHIGQGQGTGIVIHRLDIRGGAVEDAFNRAVREPLEALYQSEFDQQIVILVDALDEALNYGGDKSIVSLLAHINELPTGIRFILTSRPDSRVEHAFLDVKTLALSATQFDESNQEDIRHYVHYRLSNDIMLVEKVTPMSEQAVEQMGETIVCKAEGNFQYVRFLLNAIANGERSLTEPDGLPQGLDGLYFESLQRVVTLGKGDWHTEYAPVMGMLSVAQESPTLAQLQSFTRQSKSSVLKYLNELWQFIEEVPSPNNGETRYRLYHQSVIDFLHSPSLLPKKRKLRNLFYLPAEEEHQALADWCERGDLATIWEDTELDLAEQGRRQYARAHYVTHLYGARQLHRLFAVLDEGVYGRAKVQHHDPSTLSYAQDLDLGRQAASFPGKDVLNHLPRLWKYTLLRCSLNSTADQYMPEAFEALLLLRREKEARDIAELLTKPDNKARIQLQIANYLEAQPGREREHLDLLNRTYEVLQSAGESEEKASVSQGLCVAFLRKRYWVQAEAVVDMVKDGQKKIWMLQKLAVALAEAGEWERAETIAQAIDEQSARAEALYIIGALLSGAHDLERAEALWVEAETLMYQIQDSEEQAWALEGFCGVLTQAKQWERALKMARSIEVNRRRVWALQTLCEGLARAGKWEQAEAITHEIEFIKERARALFVLGITLAHSGHHKQAEEMCSEAETMVRTIEDARAKVWALIELGTTLAEEGYREQVAAMWSEAEVVARSIEEKRSRAGALQEIGKALMQAQQRERATAALDEAEALLPAVWERKPWGILLHELISLLVQAHQWERAEALACTIEDSSDRAWALQELCEALSQAHQWERAEALASLIENVRQRARALLVLCAELARAQQWKQADAVWNKLPAINYLMREEREAKISVLQELGLALAKTQQRSQAEAVFTEAEAMVETIEEDTSRASALLDLSATLARAGYWEWAERVAHSIKQDTFRGWALQGYCMLLVQMQQWERAIAFARQIQESSVKVNALQELGIALAHALRWKQAETVLAEADEAAQKVGASNGARARALYWLGNALLEIGDQAHAEAALVQAEEVARSIEDSQARQGMLQVISIALAQTGSWERAKRVASEIEDNNVRTSALQQLGVALAQAQHWDEAEAVVQMIEDSKAKTVVLPRLGAALAQAGYLERAEVNWAEAEMAVQTINDYEGRAFTTQRLGLALAQTGFLERAEVKWKEAEANVSMIRDSKARDWTLYGLCFMLIQAQQWRRAKSVADMIEHDDEKARALVALAAALVEAQQLDEAEEVLVGVERLVHTLQDYQSKIGMLHNMANIFEKAGKPEGMVHLIQRSLLHASTKIYAIRLLSLIARLVPHKPELGINTSEAFTWVDNFSAG